MLLKHIRPVINSTPKEWIRALKGGDGRLSLAEAVRLRAMPRFRPGRARILGGEVEFVDSASFLYMCKELFGEEIYRFQSASDRPYILDCGSNIGLSLLYFKRLYPGAEIVGFEPDPAIHACLERNVRAFGHAGVTLLRKGVWSSATTLTFAQEGADGGRIGDLEPGDKGTVSIETVRLRDFLDRPVDFLKIDIEGAEGEVLGDCRDRLGNVRRLFVEFHSFQGRPQGLESILSWLAEAGFRYYLQTTGTLSRRPFLAREISAGMDMQLNVYAYRPDSA